MTFMNYHVRAELYLGSDWQTAAAQGARTFATAAQAIRFALEEAAPVSLRGVKLKVGNTTFYRAELEALYRSAAFPLPRRQEIRRGHKRRARFRAGPTAISPSRATPSKLAVMA
ncbi:MAG TPA: hypothetical protein VGN60_04215 [Devosia sp.]|jgi:hypothetical protein|nr:hypothetical protein [Devosia sp.]